MEKYFAFIFLLFPQLMLAQTGGYNNASYNKKMDNLLRSVGSSIKSL